MSYRLIKYWNIHTHTYYYHSLLGYPRECFLCGNSALIFVLNVFDEACNLGNEIFWSTFFLSRMMRFAIKLQFTTVVVVVTVRCTQTAATAMKYAPPLRSTIDRHLEHHLLISHLATLGHLSVWGVWPGSTGHASTYIGSLHRAPLVQFLSNLNIIFSRFIAWDHQQRVRWSRYNCQGKKKNNESQPTDLQWFNTVTSRVSIHRGRNYTELKFKCSSFSAIIPPRTIESRTVSTGCVC